MPRIGAARRYAAILPAAIAPMLRLSDRARLDAEINLLHLLVVLQRLRGAFQHGAAGLQHIGIVGDRERERDRLLGQQQRQARPRAACRARRRADRPRRARGRGSARPASAAPARSSARGRAPASAARRPTACRRAACAARQGAETAHRRARTARRCLPLSLSTVAPSRRFCSTVCVTNSRQPSGDSARPLRHDRVGRLAADRLAAPLDRAAARRHQPGDGS